MLKNVSRVRVLSFVTFAGAFVVFLTPSAKAPLPPAKHGLTGSYYVGNLIYESDVPPSPESIHWSQVWFSKNDFELPRAFTAPAATHVDPQVAFGQGKGFNVKDPNLPLTTWWPTRFAVPAGRDVQLVRFVAAVWKGYVHLPKAGTYYFATVSWFGPSAVYLNQARVALNGIGGAQVADPFSYAKEDVQEFVQKFRSGREDLAFSPNSRDQYVVPVSIDGPRDLPIEVQYQCWRGCFGIDLFWVTPDAPRDANGKPIAKIVPSEALYTEPPGTIEKPAVRRANSTIEADHLYVSGAAALTIRLADKDGNPVAGKRVHVNSLTSYGGSDSIVQPDKPTDEKGETKAIIRAGEGSQVAHDSTIFATDLTDLVNVAQVAHVTFQQTPGFFPDALSPYYDRSFTITPRPLVVGRPAILKTVLTNQSKSPARVTVTFLTADGNIGVPNWAEITKVKDVTLQPGESKEVSTTFTPKEVMYHKCYRVEVEGEYIALNASSRKVFAAALLPPTLSSGPALASDRPVKGFQQINSSTVAPAEPWWRHYDSCDCKGEWNDGYADGHAGRPPRRDFSGYEDDPSYCTREAEYGNGYEVGKKARETPPPPPPAPPRVPKSSWSSYNAGWYDGCSTDRPQPKNMGDNYHDYYTGFGNGRRDCPSHPNAEADWLTRFSVKMEKFSEWLGGCEKRSSSAAGTKASLTRDDGMLSAASRAAEAPRRPTRSGQLARICFERTKTDERPYYRTTSYQTRPTPAPFILSHIEVRTNPVQSQGEAPPAPNKRQGALLVAFELGSDFHLGGETGRSKLLTMIEERTLTSHEENLLIHGAVVTQPDGNYRRVAPAAADVAYAYLSALRSSYNRFQGALAAADKDWGAKQFKATQEYAALAAAALTAEAERDDRDLAELQRTPFAVRRSPESQAAFAQQLKTSGLTPELVRLMRESGSTDAQIADLQKQIIQLPPEDIGISPAEMLKEIAASRRSLAVELTRLAQATPGELAARSAQTFDLGNPHDKEETIDLYIRPVSIPPDWKLSIFNAEEQPKFKIRGIEAGKHYAVTLPSKAQVKVASVVVPVGEVGTNTTVRWAVEGKIGDELIGGMVHEMNVPYIIADLKLPPVGSKEVEEELPVSAKSWVRIAAEIAAGVIILALLVYFFIFLPRRRRTGTSAAP